MTVQIIFLVFVFILLVFVALNLAHGENKLLLLALTALSSYVIFGYILSPDTTKEKENFQEGTAADDTSLSKYGNISLSTDIDSAQQRILGMEEDLGENNPKSIDNADVVQSVVLRGSSYFQPNWLGITTTSNGQYTNFSLAEPPEPGKVSKYDMTLSGSQNLDELLSRKQQQRQYTAKQSLDGHVRSTRNMFNKYFNNELLENEQKEWWNAEAVDYETDFRPWT